MKKLLGIPLLALMVAILCVPAVASAGSPFVDFSSVGTITSITEGNVVPAGDSGRYVVKERVVEGAFGAPLAAPYTFTYGSNVPIETQSGSIHGTLEVGDYEAKVRARSSPVGGGFCPGYGFFGVLSIEGSFAFTAGTQGQGTFGAVVWAVIDGEGHIQDVLPAGLDCYNPEVGWFKSGVSGVTIDGKWKQP